MDKKILVATLYIKDGKPVRSNWDLTVIGELRTYAKLYNDSGIDKIFVFDLSDDDDEHEKNLRAIRELNRMIDIPTCGGGNIRRMDDIKRLLYAGCKQIMLNAAKNGCIDIARKAADRFGNDRILVSVQNVDFIFKNKQEMTELFHEVLVMEDTVLDAVDNLSNTPYVVLYDGVDFPEIYALLERENARGICGPLFNDPQTDIMQLKTNLGAAGLWMDNFKPQIQWSQLKKNSDGMVPCIVQDYQTGEVLMLAYMNEEAYEKTLSIGKMTYYSRSRQELWTKGETSGHLQYVKSLTADCDYDTILAKVSQVGVACHTGNPTCFFNEIVKKEYVANNPLKVFENSYQSIMNSKANPKKGSYIRELFEKGLDEMLKKLGEEATGVVIAAKNPDPEQLKHEIAEMIYYLMTMMVETGVTWEDITKELAQHK